MATDRYVTVYGRMPVLEALADEAVAVDRVLLARTARGDTVDEIVAAARRRGVTLQKVAPEKVTRLSGNGRHDQGVVAEVAAPGVQELDGWLATAGRTPTQLLVLDGVTNPSNVGMIIRTATAAGLDGLVLPRAGSPDVGPLVVKASAGVAFRATILAADTALDAVDQLLAAGVEVVGLAAGGPDLFTSEVPSPAAWVLGSEHDGISAAVAGRLASWRSLPLANGVESLNVAVTAGILAYELRRKT